MNRLLVCHLQAVVGSGTIKPTKVIFLSHMLFGVGGGFDWVVLSVVVELDDMVNPLEIN